MNTNQPQPEAEYPCIKCGKLRTKAEGGTTFTVCDECWDTRGDELEDEKVLRKKWLDEVEAIRAATKQAT